MKAHQKTPIEKPTEAKIIIQKWRDDKLSIGFVPTMGALHFGHIALIKQARVENDKVLVSIFVNPLQFNDKNDFSNYPKDIERDREMLSENGCDLIIHGDFNDFFPEANNIEDIETLLPGKIADQLEGASRPGHFAGVKTIVSRLFEISGDCRAYFGEKDYQQSKVIESISKENGYPTIVVCATVRDKSGLALSSRNTRLSEDDKLMASNIYKAMNAAKEANISGKNLNPDDLVSIAEKKLINTPITIEYIAIKDDKDWYNDSTKILKPRMLIAVSLSGVRLIDNMKLYDED